MNSELAPAVGFVVTFMVLTVIQVAPFFLERWLIQFQRRGAASVLTDNPSESVSLDDGEEDLDDWQLAPHQSSLWLCDDPASSLFMTTCNHSCAIFWRADWSVDYEFPGTQSSMWEFAAWEPCWPMDFCCNSHLPCGTCCEWS